jgi:hypothetical protein
MQEEGYYSGERISCMWRDITQERGYHARGGILLRREDIMQEEGYYSGERITGTVSQDRNLDESTEL